MRSLEWLWSSKSQCRSTAFSLNSVSDNFPQMFFYEKQTKSIWDNSFKSNLLYWKIWLQGKYERASEGWNGATLWSERVFQKMSNVLVCPASESFLASSATSLALTSSAMIDNSVNHSFEICHKIYKTHQVWDAHTSTIYFY